MLFRVPGVKFKSLAMMSDDSSDSTPAVIALLFIWLILILVLVFFYKKLNKDTNGQYDIHRLITAEGGLRDQLRERVGAVENRFGVHIWPQPHAEQEEDLRNNEGGYDEDVGNDKRNESHAEKEEQENQDIHDDSSDDYSSTDLREMAHRTEDSKEDETTEAEEDEKKQEEAAENEDKPSEEQKNEEKVELLVDFKPFAGSAIWSEPSKNEGNDLTAL